jgi:hypothetical protein
LCLGEIALHNWTEYLVKEEYITEYNPSGCRGRFQDRWLYSFDTSHRIYDKKYLLFCMVLFDKFITTGHSNFSYNRVIETGIIDKKFIHYNYPAFDNYYKLYGEDEHYYKDIAVNFIMSNRRSLINYLSKDIVHDENIVRDRGWEVDPQNDFLAYINDPFHKGNQEKFNPNFHVLREVRDAMALGLLLSQKTKNDKILFYNGRLSYRNKSRELIYNQNKFNDWVNYILQLDLTPEINQFPMPQNVTDVLFLRKQPAVISFREVFFNWVNCIANGELDIAKKIKKDVIIANNALEKYRNFEKKKKNLFYCTIDALAGQIPYLSNILSAVSPYSLRKALKSKDQNSWVTLLK